MERYEIKNIGRVMSFSEVLSAATEIARAESRLFLKALLIFAGPLELLRMILEIGFQYKLTYSNTYFENRVFMASTEGLVSIVLSVAIMAMQIIIASKITNQYTGERRGISRPAELLKVRPGWWISYTGLLLVQVFFYGLAVVVIFLIITNSSTSPFLIFLTVVAGFFALFYLYTSFSMSAFVMIDENTGVGRSIDRSFALAKGNRWFIFGLLIVLSLMIYLVILGIGMLVGLLINFVGSTGFGYGMDSFAFVALVRVLTGVVTLFGTGLVMLVLSVQYHNLKERLYAPNLEKCVDEIGKTE